MPERIDMIEASVEYEVWGAGAPRIVMLHDGLGSIAQWRDTPAELADRTGVAVMAYNRPGHGGSTPVPTGPWPTLWLHDQARLLARLLEELDIPDPFLVGHSDGGSIALLHASSGGACRGVVALAPHSFVEPVCVSAISAMRADPSRIIRSLGAHHADPAAVFEAWSGVWVSDEFGRWDIRDRLAEISCPTLVVQGDADDYATDHQLRSTVDAIGEPASGQLLPGVGHLIHHQRVDLVVDLVAVAFVAAVGRTG
ncbi:MAG: alpha/beta hydrolase [Acidimicrobiia bacterium]|nr:alpha/beta hydrolase [Acidimicrobiia bacterium]